MESSMLFKTFALTTSKEMLDNTGISIENCSDLKGFMEECKKFQKAKPEDSYPYLFDNQFDLWNLFDSLSGWVDYDTRKVDLKRPEIRDFMEFFKNCVIPSQPNLIAKRYGAAIADGEAVFAVAGSSYFNNALCSVGAINSYDEAVLTTLNGTDEKPFGIVDDAIVVSNTSKHKEEAYQFIQILLSYNVQVPTGKTYCWSPSICKHAWQSSIDAYSKGVPAELWSLDNNSMSNRITEMKPPPLEDEQKILSYLDGVNTVSLLHKNIIQILKQEMTPFFLDKESYEVCLEKAEKKISIYLSE